ncbi:hypothetical protein PG994_015247 [Apiospora phragmitis]|uniref:Uncharacterized protein n=1 Tax=Apiospora phragmitis TaxID=2905665 RepID=A0ABR1SR03_9PEZI
MSHYAQHTSRRQTPTRIQAPNMPPSKPNEAPHSNNTAGRATHTAAHETRALGSYVSEPARSQDSCNNQIEPNLPIFTGGEMVTDLAKNLLISNASDNHTTQRLTSHVRETPSTLSQLQVFSAPNRPAIGSFIEKHSTKADETVVFDMGPPERARRSTSAAKPFTGQEALEVQTKYQYWMAEAVNWQRMRGNLVQRAPDVSQDNAAACHHLQPGHSQRYPDSLSTANNTTKKALNPGTGPGIEPLVPNGRNLIGQKRKAWLQENPTAPKSDSTEAQASPQNETAKGLPRPSAKERLTSASMITAITSVDSYEAMKMPTSSMQRGELIFSGTGLHSVLPRDFPYLLAKIDKPTEVDGVLKFEATWKPVFVPFAQIRGEARPLAKLATHLSTIAAKVAYDTRLDTAVPKTATAFDIEYFKGWETVLCDGKETLLLQRASVPSPRTREQPNATPGIWAQASGLRMQSSYAYKKPCELPDRGTLPATSLPTARPRSARRKGLAIWPGK